jgi:hypothetical protein
MMSLGQIATIAWLMKDRQLAPEKAGRELLTNCFAAVRPDAEWFKYFREGMEKATGSIEAYGRDGVGTLTLQAARRIAQEESLGSATLVRELNMAEILSRATAEREADVKRQEAEVAAIQAVAASEKAALIKGAAAHQEAALLEVRHQHEAAIEEERARVKAATEELFRQTRIDSSNRWAHRVVVWLRGVLLAAFLIMTSWSITLRVLGESTAVLWTLTAILGVVQIVTFANFLKVPLVANWIQNFESWISKEIDKIRTSL